MCRGDPTDVRPCVGRPRVGRAVVGRKEAEPAWAEWMSLELLGRVWTGRADMAGNGRAATGQFGSWSYGCHVCGGRTGGAIRLVDVSGG